MAPDHDLIDVRGDVTARNRATCICGHTREHHAWGLYECEDVYPYRRCLTGCLTYREVK